LENFVSKVLQNSPKGINLSLLPLPNTLTPGNFISKSCVLICTVDHDYLIVNMQGQPITERGVRYVLNDVVKRTSGDRSILCLQNSPKGINLSLLPLPNTLTPGNFISKSLLENFVSKV
jgi:hypothetical protein